MKVYAAVITGAFSALATFICALYGTSCNLSDLFFLMALAYVAGISVVMSLPERRKKNDRSESC